MRLRPWRRHGGARGRHPESILRAESVPQSHLRRRSCPSRTHHAEVAKSKVESRSVGMLFFRADITQSAGPCPRSGVSRYRTRVRRGMWAVLIAVGAIFPSRVGFSQEEDELSLLFSKTEVTTASKIAEPAALAPADVTVITEEEIRRSGARDLADVLRTVPGIELQRDQFGAVQIVSRGLLSPSESNYILLLLDGVPANIPYYGGASLVYDDLALVGVKRIEVVRGPGSALYGASAFAGVIQIITKSGDDEPGSEVEIGGGSFSTAHAAAQTRFKIGTEGALALHADVLHSGGPKIRVEQDAFSSFTGPDGKVSDAPGDLATYKDKVHF